MARHPARLLAAAALAAAAAIGASCDPFAGPSGTAPTCSGAPSPTGPVRAGQTRVSGRIVHSSGAPAPGVWVVLQSPPTTIQSDADGQYAIDLPSGTIDWRLVFIAGGCRGQDGTQVGTLSFRGVTGPSVNVSTTTIP